MNAVLPNSNYSSLLSAIYPQVKLPPTIVVMVNFSKKYKERIWSKERADGTVGVVATALTCANLTKSGKTVKPEKFTNLTVEVRFKQKQYDDLVEYIAEMEAVGADLVLSVKDNPVFNILTVKGKDVNALTFYVEEVKEIKEGTSTLESMEFEEQNELDSFLEEAQQQWRDKRDTYRAERREAVMKQDQELMDAADAEANDPASVLD